MSRERDLLQTALGILEDYEWGYGGDHHKSPEASILNDIRKLLAQPEPEPSSDDFMYNKLKESYDELVESSLKDFQRGYGAALTHAIYVKEPTRKPLSTDTMLRLITEHRDFPLNLVRAVEKEHGLTGGSDE